MRSWILGGLALVSTAALSTTALGALQLQYTFDEASGNALDTGAGVASDGTLQGGAVRSSNTPSGSGSSMDFPDALYAHVLSGDAAKLDGIGKITVSTWLNLRAYPGASSSNARLAAKQAATTFGGFNFSLNGTTNEGGTAGSSASDFRLGFFVGNNVSSGAADFGAAFSGADVDAASKWVFLAVTYDNTLASGNTQFYIGGVNSAVVPLGTAQTLPQVTIDGGAARFGVGFTDAAPTADTSADGLQDDVRVYDQALTLLELESVRAANVPEPTSLAAMGLAGAALLARRRRQEA
jgi:hypothetical protein